jgi:predicted O-methyltransferase YrrM
MDKLPEVLTDSMATGEAVDATGNAVGYRDHIELPDARRLYQIVRKLKPEHSIEIGLGMGASALAIAQALEDNGTGTHHVIDPFQDDYDNVGLASLERAGLMPRVDFHRAFPEAAVPTLPMATFAFIDGSHIFDLTILDFVVVDKRLAVGGVVAFDDSGLIDVQKALRYIVLNRSYTALQPAPLARSQRLRKHVGGALARLPGAARVLRPEILRPSATTGTVGSRVVYLTKNADDSGRHWSDGFTQF